MIMSIPHLFDVHTHFAAYANETDAVIQRGLDAGIWMVNVGTQADISKATADIAKRFAQGVYATIGLHPIQKLVQPFLPDTAEKIKEQIVVDGYGIKIKRGNALFPRLSSR